MPRKSYPLRIDPEMMAKLHHIAEYDGRSVNNLLRMLIRACIDDFETGHGKIEIPPSKGDKK